MGTKRNEQEQTTLMPLTDIIDALEEKVQKRRHRKQLPALRKLVVELRASYNETRRLLR